MNRQQNTTSFLVTPPAAISDNAALVCNVIDTLGYRKLAIDIEIGATDIAMAVLKIQESDTKSNTTALTTGTDITGLVFGTSNTIAGTASTLPISTVDNTVVRCEIDLKGRKRYILPVATTGDGAAGTYLTIRAALSDPEISPTTAAARGYGQILRV